MLDVVFNHTAEGNENGPDDLVPRHRQQDLLHADAGRLLLQLQRHAATRSTATTRSSATWCSTACATGRRSITSTASASTWRRFSAATRTGAPLANPPLLETLAYDPVLGKCKLIAEAWDAGGLYQVGSFPAYGRWAEWNGKYRDAIASSSKATTGLRGRDGAAPAGLARPVSRARAQPRRSTSSPATTVSRCTTWSRTTTSTTKPTARTTATAPTTTTAGTAAGKARPRTPASTPCACAR